MWHLIENLISGIVVSGQATKANVGRGSPPHRAKWQIVFSCCPPKARVYPIDCLLPKRPAAQFPFFLHPFTLRQTWVVCLYLFMEQVRPGVPCSVIFNHRSLGQLLQSMVSFLNGSPDSKAAHDLCPPYRIDCLFFLQQLVHCWTLHAASLQ